MAKAITEQVGEYLAVVDATMETDAERGDAVGVSRQTIALWRKAVDEGGEVVVREGKVRKAIAAFLRDHRPADIDGYRNGLRTAIVALKATLAELEEKLAETTDAGSVTRVG